MVFSPIFMDIILLPLNMDMALLSSFQFTVAPRASETALKGSIVYPLSFMYAGASRSMVSSPAFMDFSPTPIFICRVMVESSLSLGDVTTFIYSESTTTDLYSKTPFFSASSLLVVVFSHILLLEYTLSRAYPP